jgi:hypothetical protein
VGLDVGIGVSVGDAGVSAGVAVAVHVRPGDGVSSTGKRMMVGSGGTSCPQADRRSTATTKHRTELAATALLIPCFLFIAQGLNGVEARCS